mmetsp:Transcript_69504/g.157113  ORF Transcript_69504/g.157113 Transcript_69504/m.157113 type:complete len:247 (-) Transcript_69504:327-1067(-)
MVVCKAESLEAGHALVLQRRRAKSNGLLSGRSAAAGEAPAAAAMEATEGPVAAAAEFPAAGAAAASGASEEEGSACGLLGSLAFRFPSVACGLLLWAEAAVSAGSGFLDHYHLTPVPTMLRVTQRAVAKWPLLRPRATRWLETVLVTRPALSLTASSKPGERAYVANDNQREALHCLAHLACGAAYPLAPMACVLRAVNRGQLDRSSARDFLRKVAEAAAPPFSTQFESAVARLSTAVGLPKSALA